MDKTVTPGLLPYQTISAALGCVIVGFLVALAVGLVEVRRRTPPNGTPVVEGPTSKPVVTTYVQRVRSAESLLNGQNVRWVYKFAGGLPKCWAEIDSEGNKQTVGPWVASAHPGFVGIDPKDRPVPESVEGYVALFGPVPEGQTYRLVCAVTKVEYPENPKHDLRMGGFREPLEARLPDLLPRVERPMGEGSGTSRGGSYRDDGEHQQPIALGEDVELNFLINQETPSGKDRSIRFKFRFLTPAEVEAGRR